MMPFPTNAGAAYALLMVLIIATMSTTMAQPLCSEHEERDICELEGCFYFFPKRACIPFPTESDCTSIDAKHRCRQTGCGWSYDQDGIVKSCVLTTKEACEVIDGKRACRRKGCLWNQNRDSCYHYETEIDLDSVDDNNDNNDRGGSDDNDDFLAFWETLKGMNASEAIQEINNKFGDYYNVVECGFPDPDLINNPIQCFVRTYDETRVKLSVDENSVVHGTELDRNESPLMEKLDPSYTYDSNDSNDDDGGGDGNDNVASWESFFWETLIGMDDTEAIQEINNRFEDYYHVVVCNMSNPNPNLDLNPNPNPIPTDCIDRMMDEKRVKLIVDVDNVVKETTVGV